MNKFVFWQRWLFVVALVASVFGVILAFFNGTSLFALIDQQVNPVFWGSAEMDAATRSFQQWNYGIVGAAMASWGILVAFIAHYPFRRKEMWAWNCLLLGLLVWFIIDTAISLKFQVFFNALFNTGLAVLVLVPLVMTRNDMGQTPK